jgi:2'-5' RNA ligase
MRLFTALELNSKVVGNLTELVRRLRPYAPIRWVHPQNMHVTLKYIGEWPGGRAEEVVRALSSVKHPGPMTVPLAGLGFFPSSRHPRVFWVGAENTTALRQLASGIDAVLQPLGIAPEVRPYQPHLTLGRIVDKGPFPDLDLAIEELPSREFGTITPDRFVLFESTMTQSGPIYRKVAEFPFVDQVAERAVAASVAGRPLVAAK